MIDFRYHLVSLISVLLALAIGMVLGSGFLGGRFLDHLKARVQRLSEQNQELDAQLNELDRRLDQATSFAQASESHLIDQALRQRTFVVFQFDGVDGELVDSLREELERAGGTVASTITLTDRMALADDAAEDDLAVALDSSSAGAISLLAEAANDIGRRAAAAAAADDRGARSFAAASFEELVASLQDAGFIAVDRQTDETVPRDASFLMVGGGDALPALDVASFAPALGEGLASRGSDVLAAERSESAWELVPAVREDTEARDVVMTVDNADTIEGRIATVLALEQRGDGTAGHYGRDEGATGLLPEPQPSP